MPPKIHYPKKNKKHKKGLLIAQGKCDDAANVTGELLKNGVVVPGGQKLTKKKKQWAFLYKGLTKGNYQFTVTEANLVAQYAAAAAGVDVADFPLDPDPPPAPGVPPTVVTPADNDEVAIVFYPTGSSNQMQAVTVVFSGNGQNVNGVVTGPDANGDWSAEVDVSACPSSSGYMLDTTNSTGTTPVTNLTIP